MKIWSQFEADIWIKSVGTHQQRVTRKSDTKNVKSGKRENGSQFIFWRRALSRKRNLYDDVQKQKPPTTRDGFNVNCDIWYLILVLQLQEKKENILELFPILWLFLGSSWFDKMYFDKIMTAVDDKEGCRWHLILFKLERSIPDSEQDTKLVLLATADFRF